MGFEAASLIPGAMARRRTAHIRGAFPPTLFFRSAFLCLSTITSHRRRIFVAYPCTG
jgi:hypothetical protein